MMVKIVPDPIMRVALGFMAAKHLFVANEIGLFAALAQSPATLDELAQRIGVPQRTTRIIADAVLSLGLIENREGRYLNSEAASAFLGRGPAAGLGPALRHMNRISYPLWQNLETGVRSGGGESHWGKWSEEEQRIASEGIAAFNAPNAAALPEAYDFARHRMVLDLGGGTGSFLAALLGHYPALRGTLYELPATADVARQSLSRSPERARVNVVDGDFFTDLLPEGADVVLLANVVHLFSPAQNRTILRRAREHVGVGARLLILDFWTDPTHTQPPAAPLMAGEFLLWAGDGDVYSVDEAGDWLRDSGWHIIDHKPLTGPFSFLIAETR